MGSGYGKSGPEDRIDACQRALFIDGAKNPPNDEWEKWLDLPPAIGSKNYRTGSISVAHRLGHPGAGELALTWMDYYLEKWLSVDTGRVYHDRQVTDAAFMLATATAEDDTELVQACDRVLLTWEWLVRRLAHDASGRVLLIGGRSLGHGGGYGPLFADLWGGFDAPRDQRREWRWEAFNGPLRFVKVWLSGQSITSPRCLPAMTWHIVRDGDLLAVWADGAPGGVSSSTGSVLGAIGYPDGTIAWLPGPETGESSRRWRGKSDRGRCWYDGATGLLWYTSIIPGWEVVSHRLDLSPGAVVERWGPDGYVRGTAAEILSAPATSPPVNPPPPPADPPAHGHTAQIAEIRRIAEAMRSPKRPKWLKREADALDRVAGELEA